MVKSTYFSDTWGLMQAGSVLPNAIGITGLASARTSTSIDYTLKDDVFFRGIEFIARNQSFGDTLSLEVIDTNGITGVPPGTTILTPVSNWNLVTDFQRVLQYMSVTPQKALATMTLRLTYNSTGNSDVNVAINYIFLKPII